MTIGLNQKCLDRLVEALAQQLQSARVDTGGFLDFESTREIRACEKILPEGKQKELLTKYIGETPLYDFLFETFHRNLYESGKYDFKSGPVALSSIPEYTDAKAAARALAYEFNSLPWSYTATFELSGSLGKMLRSHVTEYRISDQMRLVSPDASYKDKFPLVSGIELRDKHLFPGYGLLSLFPGSGGLRAQEWNQEALYIQIDAQGFIGNYIRTTPVEDITSSLKAFFGLSLAVNLLRIKKNSLDWPFGPMVKSYLIIHKRENDNWVVWTVFELPLNISETINKLEFDDFNGSIDASQIGAHVKYRLQMIASAFRNPEKAKAVLLAGEWLLDSYVGKNELLSFVQTAVAMEILLGEEESDEVGIGELLRNRCAYLIGKTHTQRKEILEDFKAIYKVRSNIVHRGKSRLTFNERWLFEKLRWMCRQVITEEIKLIVEDKEKVK